MKKAISTFHYRKAFPWPNEESGVDIAEYESARRLVESGLELYKAGCKPGYIKKPLTTDCEFLSDALTFEVGNYLISRRLNDESPAKNRKFLKRKVTEFEAALKTLADVGISNDLIEAIRISFGKSKPNGSNKINLENDGAVHFFTGKQFHLFKVHGQSGLKLEKVLVAQMVWVLKRLFATAGITHPWEDRPYPNPPVFYLVGCVMSSVKNEPIPSAPQKADGGYGTLRSRYQKMFDENPIIDGRMSWQKAESYYDALEEIPKKSKIRDFGFSNIQEFLWKEGMNGEHVWGKKSKVRS